MCLLRHSPAQGERNQMVNAKFTRPVNVMPMSSPNVGKLTISLFYDKLCCFSVDDLRKGDIPVVKLFTSKSVDS